MVTNKMYKIPTYLPCLDHHMVICLNCFKAINREVYDEDLKYCLWCKFPKILELNFDVYKHKCWLESIQTSINDKRYDIISEPFMTSKRYLFKRRLIKVFKFIFITLGMLGLIVYYLRGYIYEN